MIRSVRSGRSHRRVPAQNKNVTNFNGQLSRVTVHAVGHGYYGHYWWSHVTRPEMAIPHNVILQ